MAQPTKVNLFSPFSMESVTTSSINFGTKLKYINFYILAHQILNLAQNTRLTKWITSNDPSWILFSHNLLEAIVHSTTLSYCLTQDVCQVSYYNLPREKKHSTTLLS